MGDLFKDRLESSVQNLAKHGAKVAVTPDKQFVGWDAFKKVVAVSDVNYVILATPPAFRPMHLRAAIEAGKHVFTEKPVAVDPAGIKSVSSWRIWRSRRTSPWPPARSAAIRRPTSRR